MAANGAYTVKMLRDEIRDLPDDMEVYMSIDPEGNGFHTLYTVEVSESQGEGREMNPCHPEYVASGEYEGAELRKTLVLWP